MTAVNSKQGTQYIQIVKLQYKEHVLGFHGTHNNGVWKISRGEKKEKHQRWPNEANKNIDCEYYNWTPVWDIILSFISHESGVLSYISAVWELVSFWTCMGRTVKCILKTVNWDFRLNSYKVTVNKSATRMTQMWRENEPMNDEDRKCHVHEVFSCR